MREDVLKIIRSTKDVTNAVILSHSIDFVFVQAVVIPALRKCGSPKLTIFADAECAAEAYQSQARLLSSLGRRYRVVPVAMKTGFRFHPKAVLLSGPKAATLLIGSGNLTFGGWRENGEIWCRFDSKTDGTGVFAAFHAYMHQIVELCALPRATIATEIGEAFDANTRTWAANMAPPQRLLSRGGQGSSMLEQMKTMLGDGRAEHLYVCAPYFDEKAEALQAIAHGLGAASTTVLVQGTRTNLRAGAARGLGAQFSLKAATFTHKEKIGSGGDESTRKALLHAKYYGVLRGDEVTVFAGSANCSRAALTIAGSAGNAELMAHATYPKAEFEAGFVDELVVDDEEPVLLAEPVEEPPTHDGRGSIRIRAARMELGHIQVAYQVDPGTKISAALVDDMPIEPTELGDGRATFRSSHQPLTIVLVGRRGDAQVSSLSHWIDNEDALRVSAKGRFLTESIESRLRGEVWCIGAWSDVLSELYKHLQYMPSSSAHHRTSDRGGDDGGKEPAEFEWSDVFSDSYSLPVGSGFMASFSPGGEGRVGGLRSMLLRWYGIVQLEPEGDGAGEERPTQPGAATDNGGDGDDIDKVTALPKAVVQPKSLLVTDGERRRARKLVAQVSSRLAEPDYLSERRPELLAADLRVAVVLLRAGLAEEWLTEQEFFDATLTIWLPLFFNAGSEESTGWLEQRYLTAPYSEKFAETIRSVELASALGCWALSTQAKATSPEHARFDLASALSVAQLPWLWQTGGNERIAKEIAEAFAYTSRDQDLDWKSIEHRWLTLIRRGYALDRLQKAIASVGVVDLRGRIRQRNVEPGELLWQGNYGFCVAKQDCDRADGQKVEVLVLQQNDVPKLFVGSYLMPVAGLLEDGVLDEDTIPAKVRKELQEMVEELRVGLAA